MIILFSVMDKQSKETFAFIPENPQKYLGLANPNISVEGASFIDFGVLRVPEVDPSTFDEPEKLLDSLLKL